MKKILQNLAILLAFSTISLSLAATDSTFGTTSLSLSDQTGCSTAIYTFTQTLGGNGDFQINVGHNVTIIFPSGTDASTFTGGTFNGGTISGATTTATQITFTAPSQVKKNNTFTIVLNGITNGNNLSDNCTVSTANASSGTNSATYAFTTNACPCSAVSSFPWTENFDGLTTPNFPSCWLMENGDWTTTTNSSSTYDADANSGTQFLRESYSATNEYIWTIGFQLTSGTSYDFSFFWAGDDDSGWTGDVFYNTSQSSTGATQLGSSFVTSGTTTTKTYKQETYTLIPSSTGIYYFSIRVNASSSPWYLSFDDFSLQVTPSCTAPSTLGAASITNSQAALSWTENGSATQWDVELGITGFSPTGTPTQSGVTNPYTYTGLSASTTYEYYVRADCGGSDYSLWVGPFEFTTACASVTTIDEDFDGVSTPDLPNCWSKFISPSYSSQTVETFATSPNTSPNCARLYGSGSSTAATAPLLISPFVANLGAGTHQLRFYAKGASSNTSVIVGTMSNLADETTFTSFQTVTGLSTSAWTEYIVSFAGYSGSDDYIAFKHPVTSTYSYIYIDDVIWEIIPTCPYPSDLSVASITDTQASLSWTESGTAISWDIELGITGFSPTGTPTQSGVTNSYTYTGLNASTTYEYYVRADCGGSDYSSWVGPFEFTTTQVPGTLTYTEGFESWPTGWTVVNASQTNLWEVGSAVAATGSNSAYISDDGGTSNNYTNTISITHMYRDILFPAGSNPFDLQFKWKADGESSYDYLRVSIVSTSTEPTEGVLLGSGQLGSNLNQETTWQTENIQLDAATYAGNTWRLVFTWKNDGSGGTQPPAAIDDIEISVISCADPSALTSSSISGTQESLNWTENGSATQWDIELGTSGFSPTGTPTQSGVTNPYTYSGLTATTSYEYYVRSDCGGSDYSNWIGPFEFTTACGTYTPTYIQDFASYIPSCWTESIGTLSAPSTLSGTSSNWQADGFANDGTTGAAKLNIFGTSCDEWLISPSIDLGDGSTNYQLDFDLSLTDFGSTSTPDLTGSDDKFAVIISTDNGATWISANTLMLWDNASSPNVYNNISTTGEKIVIDLTAYTGVVKFGLYGESTTSNADNDLFIDNFRVMEIPTCPQPIALTASNILPDQADLSWTEFATATQWDIEFGTNGFSPTGTPTQSGVTNPYTITGLTGTTDYEYYVRADCGGGDESLWSGPYPFTSAEPYMNYTSSTTTQNNIDPTTPASTNQEIVCIEVVTTGPTSPISITDFELTTLGSTSPGTDVINAKLYYTGTSSTFSTATQFGSPLSGPNGTFTISGTQALSEGTNYFWLTYDINAGAALHNKVDARCTQITVDGSDFAPTVKNPAGDREILDLYLISDVSIATTCSGTFLDAGGASGDYSDNELYTRTFTAGTPGSALQFVFTSFETESADDLYIYDGPNDTYPQITGSPFNGTTSPGTITSNGSYLTFKFDSDGSVQNSGWEATISCIPITPPACPTYNTPTDTEVDVCPGSVVLDWTAAATGFATEGYKLYFGTNNPPNNIINGTDLGNVTTYELTNLASNTTFYWEVVPYNSAGDNSSCSVYSFTTLNLGITSTNSPITTCQNTATLTATGNGTITWYDVATGGSPIATGGSYNATFSGNTTYYVAAESSGSGTESGGNPSADGSDGSFITTPDWGIKFDATDDIEIISTTIYPVGTGTVTIALLNDAGNEIAATSAINVTGTDETTPVVVPLGFSISAGSNYKIVLKDYTGLTGMIRDYSVAFPYPSPSGAINVTNGWTGSGTSTSYYWFYNIQVTSGCVSAREAVIVNHTAEPIIITPDGPTTFLDGNSVGLAASSAESPAYTYTWSPSTGLSATTGTSVTASPNTTTTYTVTGANGSCSNTEDITITVTYPCTGLGTGHTAISSLPFNETSTTCGAVDDITSSNATVCGSTSYYTGEDVVYSFTPSSTGQVTIDLTSTGSSTGLMLYDDCPMSGQGGSCVAYAQSSSGNEFICVNLEQDVTYYLVIDSYDSPDCNPYTINISAPDPNGVINDLPCNATSIAIGGLQSGNLMCTSGVDEPSAATCWSSGTLNTVWYEFVAPASGSVKIRTTLGTLTKSQIAVYQGDCTNLTIVANSCNQDANGACSGTTENSAIELTGLTTGTTYYLRIDGEYEEVGTFDVAVIDGIDSWPTVPQQDCGSATLVCNQQTVVGDPGFLGAGSTCDYSTPYGCFSFGTQNNTVWYQIDINANGTLLFDIAPNSSTTDYDWALINVTGNSSACDQIANGTLSPIRCNFSGTTDTTGLRTGYTETSVGASGDLFLAPLSVTNGDTYQLLIWNWSGNNTGFTLDMQTTSPVNYVSPTSLTWSGGANTDWFNPINWGGCDIPDCGIDVIIVNGPTNQPNISAAGAECKNISIEAGASLTIDAGETLTVCQNFSNIGSLNMDPTSTILFNNASANHELDGSLTGINALGNLTVNKTGGSVKFLQDTEIQGDLTTLNATSIVNTNEKTITLGGDFLPWNLTYNGIGITGKLIFNGTSQQNYNPGGLVVLHDVTINNTSGGVLLHRNIELDATGTLNLINGIIETSTNKVIVNNTSSTSVNAGNSNSYINGDLRRHLASNTEIYSFPVGTSSAYRLAQITNNNMTGLTYIDAKFISPFTNTGSLNTTIAQDGGTPYESIASEGIWQLDPDIQPTGGNYAISLWFDGGGTNAFASMTDNKFGPLKRASGSSSAADWTAQGGTLNSDDQPGRTVASGYAKRSGWTSFSHFSIAKTTLTLPVTLKYLDAYCTGNDIYINWATIQEINNKYFTIFKSNNAENFYEIGKIDGAGNSSELNEYHFIDKHPITSEVLYYKISQTDFDGTSNDSKIISVKCSEQNSNNDFVTIEDYYNSPEIDIIYNIYSDSKSKIQVIDNLGRELYCVNINISDNINHKISKSQFKPGIYTIVVTAFDKQVIEKILITK